MSFIANHFAVTTKIHCNQICIHTPAGYHGHVAFDLKEESLEDITIKVGNYIKENHPHHINHYFHFENIKEIQMHAYTVGGSQQEIYFKFSDHHLPRVKLYQWQAVWSHILNVYLIVTLIDGHRRIFLHNFLLHEPLLGVQLNKTEPLNLIDENLKATPERELKPSKYDPDRPRGVKYHTQQRKKLTAQEVTKRNLERRPHPEIKDPQDQNREFIRVDYKCPITGKTEQESIEYRPHTSEKMGNLEEMLEFATIQRGQPICYRHTNEIRPWIQERNIIRKRLRESKEAKEENELNNLKATPLWDHIKFFRELQAFQPHAYEQHSSREINPNNYKYYMANVKKLCNKQFCIRLSEGDHHVHLPMEEVSAYIKTHAKQMNPILKQENGIITMSAPIIGETENKEEVQFHFLEEQLPVVHADHWYARSRQPHAQSREKLWYIISLNRRHQNEQFELHRVLLGYPVENITFKDENSLNLCVDNLEPLGQYPLKESERNKTTGIQGLCDRGHCFEFSYKCPVTDKTEKTSIGYNAQNKEMKKRWAEAYKINPTQCYKPACNNGIIRSKPWKTGAQQLYGQDLSLDFVNPFPLWNEQEFLLLISQEEHA